MLTAEQVKKGATTPKKALELSIKHWWENYNLTREELAGEETPCAECLCGLCKYYHHSGTCENCPIEDRCEGGSFYEATSEAEDSFYISNSDKNYHKWRKAAKAMHKYLCSLRDKELKVRK